MGRNCGYIALMSGIAGRAGTERPAGKRAAVPKKSPSGLRAAYKRGKTHALAV